MVRPWVLCACLAFAVGCERGEEEEHRPVKSAAAGGAVHLSDEQMRALDLAVVPAAEGSLPDIALRFGRSRPTLGEEALVVSPFAGRIPKPPAVKLGSKVAAGVALVDVVPALAAGERISVNVQGAELSGQIAAAERELALHEAALVRARELAASQIVSQAKLQEAETEVATTRARLIALRSAAAVAKSGEGAPHTLRAPIAGTVVTLNATVGAVVAQGDLLLRIVKAGPRWVEVAVAPNEPAGRGYEVDVAGTWRPAHLVAPGAVVEADGSRHDRLQLDEGDAAALVPGQTVSVRVARDSATGVVLPESAIATSPAGDRVFVETADRTFAPREVRVAAAFAGKVRLASGIKPGERIVVRGVMALDGEMRRAALGEAD